MSIRDMIALHPDVDGNVNEPLARAVRHAMFCQMLCTSCADACIAEEHVADMRQCIRTCLDCADICGATATIATRRAGSNEALIQAMLETCVLACDICAAECARHQHDHCLKCAEMCRETEQDCREALTTFG